MSAIISTNPNAASSAISTIPAVANAPDEIWAHIFGYLDYPNLRKVTSTCKTLNQFVENFFSNTLQIQKTVLLYDFISDLNKSQTGLVAFFPNWHETKRIQIQITSKRQLVSILGKSITFKSKNPFIRLMKKIMKSDILTSVHTVKHELDKDFTPLKIDAIRYCLQEAATNDKDAQTDNPNPKPLHISNFKTNKAWKYLKAEIDLVAKKLHQL